MVKCSDVCEPCCEVARVLSVAIQAVLGERKRGNRPAKITAVAWKPGSPHAESGSIRV
jgi:hypothetical protein